MNFLAVFGGLQVQDFAQLSLTRLDGCKSQSLWISAMTSRKDLIFSLGPLLVGRLCRRSRCNMSADCSSCSEVVTTPKPVVNSCIDAQQRSRKTRPDGSESASM